MATYPSITANAMFENTQLFVFPEALVILQNGLTSDRIRRIQYGDITRVSLGRKFPAVVFILTLLGSLLGIWAALSWDTYWFGLIIAAPFLIYLALVTMHQKTFLEVETLGSKVKIAKYGLSGKKRERIMSALLDNIIREQGQPPARPQFPERTSPVFAFSE